MQAQDKNDETTDDEGAAESPLAADPAAKVETVEHTYVEAEVRAKLEAVAAEAKDRVLRIAAEYENYRRRVQREKEQWTSEAIERFAGDLLPVLDDFDRALAAKSESASAVVDGIRLTEKQLRVVLARHGVERVDPAAGEKFDPKLHEAIQRAPAGEKTPPGTVVAVFEKGYVLKGKLLRPARVVVAGEAN